MSTLIMFETKAQLRALLRKYSHQDNIWVALSPEADYAAECANLPYSQIENYYNADKLTAMGIDNFGIVDSYCDCLDKFLCIYLKGIYEVSVGFVSAHQALHAWKTLFDVILSRSFAVRAVIEKTKPCSIVAFKDAAIEKRDGFGFLSSSAFRSVIPIVAEHYNIKLTRIPSLVSDWQSLPDSQQRQSWLFHHILGSWRFAEIATRIKGYPSREGSIGKGIFRTEKPILIVADSGYDVDYVVKMWRLLDMPVLMFTNKPTMPQRQLRKAIESNVTEMWDSKEFQDMITRFATINGLDYSPILRSRLHYYLFSYLPKAINRANIAHNLLGNIKNGVVFSILEPIACEVAHHLNIPNVNYQHGGMIGYIEAPIYEHMELYPADYFFCYGKDTERFLTTPLPIAHRPRNKNRAIPIAVGSASLDAIPHQIEHTRNDKKVIYALSALMGDYHYHGYQHYPDIFYWHLERELVTLFGKFPKIQFVVKAYPKGFIVNPLDKWLNQHPLPNVQVIRDVPLMDILGDASLLIIDKPSTTLLQALTTNAKIILYADKHFIHIDYWALELLKKRVVFSDNKEQFFNDAQRALSEGNWVLPEPINHEFLKGYGTYFNDGKSAERAIRALTNLTKTPK